MSKNNLEANNFKVAMYLRLSQDDEKYDKGFKVESNSISNQRLQIKDYIDSGRYLQRVFPSLEVRFIALNDNYDSFTVNETEKNLVIPFKNFINDNYCRDTSAKVRSVCKAKRKQGQFISNYTPYGYEKDKEYRHKIVIDKEVEYVVQKIFSMKLERYSSYSIAKHLNENGIRNIKR
ncbi:hypothetical protein [Streptococcus anginosus]|uniref:Recombinase n=1 Tax=Streptococcus anginosus subsp. whileyi CCUG 39159 TaxID=1095729 RepID=I0SIC3_STRAP|nr:hypothetical protein [Streptococcus anginosus]EID23126.1 hypothetical protein HMPREF1043_0271 [Streptococcus anginosus subsp. whileyi CCUG 39159]MDB8661877.1 hypothetical protein [Streptococcus anginosus]MDP1385758.1 hypothetical protein [Streptococcus anginosus]BAN60712.1 hypothetical protein ANG_0242 [Streptococcus anginosus subsp. whileyi MAS624]